MRLSRLLVSLVVLVGFLSAAGLAQHRDPLNEKEIDEMREAAEYPNKRIELMVNFARARIADIGQLQADPKNAKNRPAQIHDLLQDFTALLDEAGDNIEMYSSHKTDIRKGLKLLIEATSEWHLKLRTLKEKSPPEELDQYSFVLANAVDAVKDTAEDARKNLQEQNELARDKKLNKDYSERTN